jgi:DNA repair ATPase RecN
MVEEEFEIIPVNPIRRLEKRIERLEAYSVEDPKSIFKDIIEIVRMNQQIVDELAKSNDALRVELSKLPGRLDELIGDMKELINFIRASGESEQPSFSPDVMKPVVEKLDALVNINKSFAEKNQEMLDLLDEVNKRLKRTSVMHTQPSIPATLQPSQPPMLPSSMPNQPIPSKPSLPLRPLPQKQMR